jgi:NAD-dependent dihydropyrimidine dehydrogenase PreA subunit
MRTTSHEKRRAYLIREGSGAVVSTCMPRSALSPPSHKEARVHDLDERVACGACIGYLMRVASEPFSGWREVITGHPVPDEGGHQRSLIGGPQRSSEAIGGNQEAIGGHSRSFKVIRGHLRSSKVTGCHQMSIRCPSEVLRGHLRSFEVIQGHWRPSEVLRGTAPSASQR